MEQFCKASMGEVVCMLIVCFSLQGAKKKKKSLSIGKGDEVRKEKDIKNLSQRENDIKGPKGECDQDHK